MGTTVAGILVILGGLFEEPDKYAAKRALREQQRMLNGIKAMLAIQHGIPVNERVTAQAFLPDPGERLLKKHARIQEKLR